MNDFKFFKIIYKETIQSKKAGENKRKSKSIQVMLCKSEEK